MSAEPLPAAARRADRSTDLSAGAALGLLLGLLVGLSASPVVSAVVTGLVALLAGLFGLSEKISPNLTQGAARRLTAFGLAAVLATPLSIWMRSAEWLTPSAERQRQQLAEIGITDVNEQRDMLRYLRYGLLPPGAVGAGKDNDSARQAQALRQGVLYAAPADLCASLRRAVADGAPSEDILTLLRAGNDATRHAATALASVAPAQLQAAASAAPIYLCPR